MSVNRALLLAALLAAAVSSAQQIDYSKAYSECTTAFQAGSEQALAWCERAAKAGVPGAQYVMGALLTNRGTGDDMAKGIEWLEKAVAAGSPPAAFHLAGVLLERQTDAAAVARGRELFKLAVCAGYPPALTELADAGESREAVGCSPSNDADFSGEWSVSLKWPKAAAADDESYRVAIHGGTARVSMLIDGKWTEVKAGKFQVRQEDQSLTVSSLDSGWDFDGKWIESWTFQFMRTGPDRASVAYLRTVNNPHLPARFDWRTFTTFAEGTARRLSAPRAETP